MCTSGPSHVRRAADHSYPSPRPRAYPAQMPPGVPSALPDPSPADCLFCGIVAGRVPSLRIDEDERTVAFLDVGPATRGHTLVVPRAHARDLLAATDEDLAACLVAACAGGRAAGGAAGGHRRQRPQRLRHLGLAVGAAPAPARGPAVRRRRGAAPVDAAGTRAGGAGGDGRPGHRARAGRQGLDLGAGAGLPRVRLRGLRGRARRRGAAAARQRRRLGGAAGRSRAPPARTGRVVAARVRLPRPRRAPPLRRAGCTSCSTRTTRCTPTGTRTRTAVAERYGEQDPAVVAREIEAAARRWPTASPACAPEQWSRRGRRSDGAPLHRDVASRSYFLHDLVHHLHDVRSPAGT